MSDRPTVTRLAQLIHDADHAYPVSVMENAEWCARVALAYWPEARHARDLIVTPMPADTEPFQWTVENMG